MKLQAILVLLVAIQPARAATITVTNTADSGPGTLRALLASAADGDLINLSVTGTILLTNGELVVSKSVTITGPGPANLAVDGNAASRGFRIAPSNTVTIAGVTITNGQASELPFPPANLGGAILNEHAALTVSNCVLSGNRAMQGGAIFNAGLGPRNISDPRGDASLRIINCTLSSNRAHLVSGAGATGGALVNASSFGDSASAQILNSTLSDNLAEDAGAIYNVADASGNASVQIVNSTLSRNRAQLEVGTGSGGGGIFNVSVPSGAASVQILNSTLSGNSADLGGGVLNERVAGGSAMVEIGSTILADGASGGNIRNYDGTVTSLGYNLSDDSGVTNFSGGTGSLNATGDQLNTDPMLGPLQDNGGPTLTHALLSGSPAIDKGKNFGGSTTDQRGFPRRFNDPRLPNAPGGDATDIGSIELQGNFNAQDAIEALIDEVSAAGEQVKPLEASLRAALKSLEKGHVGPAINQLQAFQHKVRAQVARHDPALGQELMHAAQDIIDALESP